MVCSIEAIVSVLVLKPFEQSKLMQVCSLGYVLATCQTSNLAMFSSTWIIIHVFWAYIS